MSDVSRPKISDLPTELAERVAKLRTQFEREWKCWNAGSSPIEKFLASVEPAARDALLAELVQTEMRLRSEQGQTIELREYAERFPEQAWLTQLDGQTPSEQTTIPPREEAASESATIPPRENPSEDGTLPPRETPEAPSDTVTIPPSAEAKSDSPTVQIPGYEILKELGRGGMGVVYKAVSLSLQRPCALKMIL